MKLTLYLLMSFSGITPMLQLIRRITADPADNTKCSLIFANQVSTVRFIVWGNLSLSLIVRTYYCTAHKWKPSGEIKSLSHPFLPPPSD